MDWQIEADNNRETILALRITDPVRAAGLWDGWDSPCSVVNRPKIFLCTKIASLRTRRQTRNRRLRIYPAPYWQGKTKRKGGNPQQVIDGSGTQWKMVSEASRCVFQSRWGSLHRILLRAWINLRLDNYCSPPLQGRNDRNNVGPDTWIPGDIVTRPSRAHSSVSRHAARAFGQSTARAHVTCRPER